MSDLQEAQDLEAFNDAYEEELEDDDTVDEEQEPDPTGFWEERQRELVTSVLDYNLKTLSDLIQDRKIDLSPKYQRRFRWDRKRQSQLIESFLMNVPVPPIFLNEDEYGQYSVIDGKQRLTAISSFMRGQLKLSGLKVFTDINGRSVNQLPPSLQNVLETRANLRAIIILRQSDPAVKFEVFQRLNTGGVRLNPQEIRNSAWPGPLNDMILELSVHENFHRLLGIQQPERSSLFKEMRDAEFVLRYLTFRNNWDTFSGGMMRHMDTYMADNQRMESSGLDEARVDFLSTLDSVEAAFGERAFRRWVPDSNQWRKQVLASLYDAQMIASRGRDLGTLSRNRRTILRRLQDLFANEDFRNSIDAATNTPTLFRTRIRMVSELLDEATSS
jgi:hypothetical protein